MCLSDTLKVKLKTISDDFSKTKIKFLQLDPFGFCNSKCGFCPVKYIGNPESGRVTMPINTLKRILDIIDEEKQKPDGLVSNELNNVYTAHYNEVLLYKYFEELCQEFTQRNMSQMILSNGFTLTHSKTDLICTYRSSISGMCLNIPAFNAKDWAIRTGFKEKNFDTLLSNIYYAIDSFSKLDNKLGISIQVNGVDRNSLNTLTLGSEAPTFDIDTDLSWQVESARKLFPGIEVFAQNSLVDRVGFLPKSILSNQSYINVNKQLGQEAIGCSNTFDGGKGRPFDWLHINAKGQVILCCNDYNFDYVIGDLSTETLSDFWAKDKHVMLVSSAYSNICSNCTSGVFKKVN